MEFEFEFDPAKSEVNKAKHGIDFLEAQELWSDTHRLSYETRSDTENRWVATSIWNGKFWTAIYTWRGQRIRLISVRRARDVEIKRYEDNYRRRIGSQV